MTPMMVVLTAAAAAYLIGSVPFGMLIARSKGVDIRTVGSGNIGAANVGRALGRNWGILVFFLDVAKGLVPTLLAGRFLAERFLAGRFLAGEPLPAAWDAWAGNAAWLCVGLCTVLGHNYPVFLGFRGGKGVATSFGVALGVYPDLTVPALIGLGCWVLIVGLTRISSLGSLVGAIQFPISYYLLTGRASGAMEERWPMLAFASLVAASVVIRHRANIRRLISGTEARLGGKRA